jgi:hypothetical protein
MTIVINMFAGPSAGKTTNAAELFGYMKRKRYNCEYAPEFAKDLAFNKSNEIDDQFKVFGNQHQRLYSLYKNVDYIITDSPLFLSVFYCREMLVKYKDHETYNHVQDCFVNFVHQVFNMYDNRNFFVERGDREYVQTGRFQTKEEAVQIDHRLRMLMTAYKVPFVAIKNTDDIINTLRL